MFSRNINNNNNYHVSFFLRNFSTQLKIFVRVNFKTFILTNFVIYQNSNEKKNR